MNINEKAKTIRREGDILDTITRDDELGCYSEITARWYGEIYVICMRNGEVLDIYEQ